MSRTISGVLKSPQLSCLRSLLPVCGDLESAKREYTWIKEHVVRKYEKAKQKNPAANFSDEQCQATLEKLCTARSQHYPLQYLLGTEYFGSLQLRCKAGVLIPRPATAAAVENLLARFKHNPMPTRLNMLDLCSGSGCIALLFGAAFPFSQRSVDYAFPKDARAYAQDGAQALEIRGIDNLEVAIKLAEENRRVVIKQLQGINETEETRLRLAALEKTLFLPADIWSSGVYIQAPGHWDVIISNPPYISPRDFETITERSVREYEPKQALVPSPVLKQKAILEGDEFYPRLLQIAAKMKAKVLLVEVSNIDQAIRVANMAKNRKDASGPWSAIEVWRDDPSKTNNEETIGGFRVFGEGEGRSVLCAKNKGLEWIL